MAKTLDSTFLHCIDLDQPALEGFRKFISAWFLRREGFNLLVDPGPKSTIPHLISQLDRLGVDRIDYVLLTHIHIDHAGGTGELLRTYPEARVVCHPEGIRHLVAPEKLWQGSRKVLGAAMTEAYGEILPVPAKRVGYAKEVPEAGLRAYLTPGHAVHHVCYLLGDLLFAGEAAGVRCECPAGIYMRPATPPRFILEVALDSLDRMIALRPGRMVFAHYGLVENALEHLHIGRQQLQLWVQGAAATMGLEPGRREEAFFAWLQKRDAVYRNIRQLPPDIAARERIFLGNTLRGMSDYVDNLPTDRLRELLPH